MSRYWRLRVFVCLLVWRLRVFIYLLGGLAIGWLLAAIFNRLPESWVAWAYLIAAVVGLLWCLWQFVLINRSMRQMKVEHLKLAELIQQIAAEETTYKGDNEQ